MSRQPIGIMLGRLSCPATVARQAFPFASWRDEFALAQSCGFDRLEWLVTDRGGENPIWSDSGRAEIRALTAGTGVAVKSLNAHCLIASRLLRVDDIERRRSLLLLESLIEHCAALAIDTVVVPLLEDGEIRTVADAHALVDLLGRPVELAGAAGVKLALESDAPLPLWLDVLTGLSAPVGACYDTGNRAAKSFDVAADLLALREHVCSVHIKDRRRAGPSVPLGDGDVDFTAAFGALSAINYEGPLTLETPAGEHPARQARRHLQFVKDAVAAVRGDRVHQ
ncbi:MAG TPA: sugar phosphate isomerase/epimerase family protein [Vicinamibacterales bacterium]|nr:sugar phosphate isomerase/epimerase family protein [Vicinamibacterales bacterium]